MVNQVSVNVQIARERPFVVPDSPCHGDAVLGGMLDVIVTHRAIPTLQQQTVAAERAKVAFLDTEVSPAAVQVDEVVTHLEPLSIGYDNFPPI